MEIKKILAKHVSRKDFLVLLGLFLLSFTGMRQLLDHSKKAVNSFAGHNPPKGSFGAGQYGG